MRLFVALDLPSALRAAAVVAGRRPAGRALGAAGELPPDPALHRRAAEAAGGGGGPGAARPCARAGFTLRSTGVGTFAKGGRAVSLWVGVERNPALDHLQSKVETALQRAGLEPERRRFAPHVTLARLGRRAGGQARGLGAGAQPVPRRAGAGGAFHLFSSRLGKEQAVYTPEVEYELA